MLMHMGLFGWLAALVIGFVVGGIFFITIKLQSEYVVEHRGPEWLLPVACYARLLFMAVVLVVVAVSVPGEKVAASMLAGISGSILARILIGRMVRRLPTEEAAAPKPGGRDAA